MKKIYIDSDKYPRLLKKIYNPPKLLYAEGNIDILNTNAISIVGSRSCSEAGFRSSKKFAFELACQNITIVSGMAIRNRYCSTYRRIRGRWANNSSFRRWI